MSRLQPLPFDAVAYRDLLARLLPRGPIWELSNPGVLGMVAGLGVEAVRFHNRLVDLMLEAYPSTADELLVEWEEVYGLPLCATPSTAAARRVALAGKVAAQGGQSRAYFITLAWAVLEADGEYSRASNPNGVTIEETPFGTPFVVWGSSAWESLGGRGARFYWTLHLPVGVSAAKVTIIECLMCRYKPAHTVLVRDDGSVVCSEAAGAGTPFYRCPGGSGDFLLADNSIAPASFGLSKVLGLWLRPQSVTSTKAALLLRVVESGTTTLFLSVLLSPSGADFTAEAHVYTTSHEGTTGAMGPFTINQFAFWSLELGAGGVLNVYVNNVLVGTTTTYSVPGKTGPSSTFKLTGVAGSVDFAPVWTMPRLFASAAERSALTAAGRGHDPREPSGGWPGDGMSVLYRVSAESGRVVNQGTAGACDLTLNGAASSEME